MFYLKLMILLTNFYHLNVRKKIISRSLLLALLFIMIIIFSYPTEIHKPSNGFSQNNSYDENIKLVDPKISKYWDTVQFIHIYYDNWSANDFDWIQNRTGSWSDPHIIENVTINAKNYRIGILIENSNDYFIIRNCTVYNSSKGNFDTAGIYLKNANNGSIIDNNLLFNNGSGLILENSKNNTITENQIVNNTENGMFFFCESKNNTIYANNIANNTIKGIEFNQSTSWNIIYNNNFTENKINAMDNGTKNQWYHGNLGNYWDDYKGCDANRDKIGETPYSISGESGAQDLYPICYKNCISEPREAKEEVNKKDNEYGFANVFIEYVLNNTGLIASGIIIIEVTVGITIFINKKRKVRLINDTFSSDK